MSGAEIQAHISKLRLKKREEEARANGPHEEDWWLDPEHPERLYLLHDVLWEKSANDSEDGKGNKVYIKERCPRYKKLLAEIE